MFIHTYIYHLARVSSHEATLKKLVHVSSDQRGHDEPGRAFSAPLIERSSSDLTASRTHKKKKENAD